MCSYRNKGTAVLFCVSQRMGQSQNWRSCYCQIEEQELCGYYKVLLQYYSVLLRYYSVLERTTPVLLQYYSSTTPYYKVLQHTTAVLQSATTYYSVLQSTTPVLLRTTKYCSSTTLYYSSTTLYYKVLLQYYPVLHSTTTLLIVILLAVGTHLQSKFVIIGIVRPFKVTIHEWGTGFPGRFFWILGYRSGIVRGIVRILPTFLENIHYLTKQL